MGYTNVMVYKSGIPGWAKAGNPLASNVAYPEDKTPAISVQELSSQDLSSVFILDIRPQTNFQKGHVRGSTNIDLEDLHEKFSSLPKNKKIVLVDHKGKITNITGQFLSFKDYKNVVRLDGGFNAWAKKGMPIEK